MRVVIIGGSFAGLTCAQTLNQLAPETEVVILDENPVGAYIPNGLNWLYQGRIKTLRDSLFMAEENLSQMPLKLYANHKVLAIDSQSKQLNIEHDGQSSVMTYDQLVCAMGASSRSSYIEGSDLAGVVTTKDFTSSQEAKHYLDTANHIVIIGAGLVGLEACYAYAKQGKTITLLEAGPRPDFKHTDEDMLTDLLAALSDMGVTLMTNTRARAIVKENSQLFVQTDKQTVIGDAVLLAVNFRPNSQLLDGQVTLNMDQTVQVNELMQTSDASIYAVGDLVNHLTPQGQRAYIPLISNAIRTGEQAAYGILGHNRTLSPSVKAVGHHVFGLFRYSIGSTQEEVSLYEDVVSYHYSEKLSPLDQRMLQLKLITSQADGRFLGAQVLSTVDISPLVAQLVTVMSQGLKDEQVAGQDFLMSFGQSDLYYHFHKAVQAIYEKRLGLCKSNV